MSNAYLVGAGIASLATAVYLIRDAKFPGEAIHIFDQSGDVGGSLDAQGSAESGYRLRGGRMFNYSYGCTYDLLSSIPSLGDRSQTVLDEIRFFNAAFPSSAKARLIENGVPIDASSMTFSARDRIDLIEMALRSEDSLWNKRIDQCFKASFFETNFWCMWATTFAFAPWHSALEFKRYLHRFIAEFPRLSTLEGVDRTRYNQYDSIVRPLVAWLTGRGVTFEANARVLELDFEPSQAEITVTGFRCRWSGTEQTIIVNEGDYVFATIGSMTADSSWGTMTSPAASVSGAADGSWTLWKSIARDRPALGHPDVFADRIAASTWISFTITFTDSDFFGRLQDFTGTALATLRDSPWLLSLVLSHQPHFIDQPQNVSVAWGYGLFPDREGDFVKKKMRDCSGEEILRELLWHLKCTDDVEPIVQSVICLPCMMPFITSMFLPRAKGDRPAVVPHGSTNLALIGQFCEIPDDTVFTVEYSVRAAQIAVYSLLKLDRLPTPMYDGTRSVTILRHALEKLLT